MLSLKNLILFAVGVTAADFALGQLMRSKVARVAIEEEERAKKGKAA